MGEEYKWKGTQPGRVVCFTPDDPHGWIQWKGTDVCMDVYCKCGYHSHVDGEFGYFVKCPKCGQVYECNGHIELIPIEEMEKNETRYLMDDHPVEEK